MSESVLEVHDVAVTYGDRTVLDVPHLAVRQGEVLTLVTAWWLEQLESSLANAERARDRELEELLCKELMGQRKPPLRKTSPNSWRRVIAE